ncbi:metallophosphoesterase [Pseudobutyrivibrio xylanivorans]|uniref:Serine/threonine protein phosphatase n=1 Tax=Pseudobutyrivibrio xylanivorans TaxID=185007 RepID=A0A5P6VSH1_PSEXY|nr:metallophosphoesterase [Pseudobutyrivibrio xylanivorans]QFJ55400.1 serine/threonine protein phosphatase [Pseudobutyrivibrio xylanivorans]
MIWILMFLGAFVASIAGIVFMISCLTKFNLIKNKIVAFLIIALLFCFFYFTLEWINALTITIYTTFFFLLFEFIGRKFLKNFTPKCKCYWQGWLAIICSIAYLGAGYYFCVSVVEKDYTLTTDKNLGQLKVAMIADSHLSTTFDGEGFAKHLKTIEAQSPDILLISGDFVDDGSKNIDMEKACEALGNLNLKYGVWFVYGNHDAGYFSHRDFSEADLENALIKNGVHILEDECTLIDNKFYVVGRRDKGINPNRTRCSTLVSTLDKSKYIIMLDHEPADYDAEASAGVDLVLSGHTHGGQLIPITFIGEWVGANDATYGYERRENTDFIVTSGISDWALKFKTGTRSEYVIIDITGN